MVFQLRGASEVLWSSDGQAHCDKVRPGDVMESYAVDDTRVGPGYEAFYIQATPGKRGCAAIPRCGGRAEQHLWKLKRGDPNWKRLAFDIE
jgi:hypothetical protein